MTFIQVSNVFGFGGPNSEHSWDTCIKWTEGKNRWITILLERKTLLPLANMGTEPTPSWFSLQVRHPDLSATPSVEY